MITLTNHSSVEIRTTRYDVVAFTNMRNRTK